MKKVTIVFIIVELLDCITTFVGIRFLHMGELNPLANFWWFMIPFKIFAIIIVSVALQWKRDLKIDWIFPTIAGIPVAWNLLNIIVEVAYKM